MLAQFALRGVELWSVAGWTMVHFLWLGTVVGLVAMITRLLAGRASANVRYATALASLSVLAVLPVAIAAWLVAYAEPVLVAAPAIGDGEIIELNNQQTSPDTPIAPNSAASTE